MEIKIILIAIIIFSITTCKPEHHDSSIDISPYQDTITQIQITVIDNLHDSLKPKIIALNKMPAPEKVLVPAKNGGTYSVRNINGEIRNINLEKPATKIPPILKNDQGYPVLDSVGKPFILGDGGKSHFTNFSTADGLVLNAVSCSATDKLGNLWFGTFGGGVSRYDGKSFTTFTTAQGLTNNNIWCIMEDKSGNLWFGTQMGGICKYDGKVFTTFKNINGLKEYNIRTILEDKRGNIWFGTGGGGVFCLDGKSTINYNVSHGLADNYVYNMIEDKEGNIWFGTHGGVSRYNGKLFNTFSLSQGLPHNDVTSIIQDKAGNLWFGTYGGGVCRYDGSSFKTFKTDSGLANNYVWSILEDKDGNLWFGTYGGGVCRYDGNSFKTFTADLGLANNYVWSILEDKAGNLWFCTEGGGVSRYDGPIFTNYKTSHGLANNIVWSIIEDKTGDLWFGTNGGGVSRYDGKSFTTFNESQGLAGKDVRSIFQDKAGNVWFGSGVEGISMYDGKYFTTYTTAQGLSDNNVYSILEDKRGNLWLGTDGGGVSLYDGHSFTSFTDVHGLANNNIWTILEDKSGNIWFGHEGGMVSRYDGKTFLTFSVNKGMNENGVYSIFEDKDGNIWYGTGGDGVRRVLKKNLDKFSHKVHNVTTEQQKRGTANHKIIENGKSKDVITLEIFSTINGLADNVVYDILEDKQGNIVIGTNLGFTVIPVKSSALPFSEIKSKLEYYNTPYGFPVDDINTNAMFCDSKGIIWAGTGSDNTALVRFDYAAVKKNTKPPTLVIQNVRINEDNISWYNLMNQKEINDSSATNPKIVEEITTFGKELTLTERKNMQNKYIDVKFDSISNFYPIPQNLILPYTHNNISIEYNAIETGRHQLVNYQYILEGYDKEWSPILKKTSATFGNINEGTYTYKVKSQSPGGIWSEPISYTFMVLPPFYRTWWAYAIYLLIFGYIMWKIHLFQKAKTIAKEREKARERELEHAKEIEIAYTKLGTAHENLKSTQAQLIQSEKMASLGELTAGIAHEIQNPLNFVNNFSELSVDLAKELKVEVEKFDIPVKDKEYVGEIISDLSSNQEKINHHGQRASSIVKGMLEHSRKSSGTKEPTDINALCDEYLRLTFNGFKSKEKDFNATMETQFDPTLPKIDIIPQDIGRVILNILNNAFYAVNERRKKDESESQPKVSVSTQRIGEPGKTESIQISISDNGLGIPDSIKDKIFQPFFTTKPTGQGTGLGLSLAYDIVKAHGGELKVENTNGVGTEFIINLPI